MPLSIALTSRSCRSASLALLLPTAALAAGAPPPPAPVARVAPVTDTYFGHALTDPYRWMESEPKPEFEQYLHAQDDHARAVLATIPGREPLHQAISALDGLLPRVSMLTVANGRRFYVKRVAGAQIGRLVLRDERGTETVLVDPASLDADGPGAQSHHAEIDQFAPSQDGGLVAYGVSIGGSEKSVLHVVDTVTRLNRPDVIDRAQFASVSWAPDGRHFFYTRLPVPVAGAPATAEYAHLRVFEHTLGDNPDHDRLILDTDHLPFPFKAQQAFASVAAIPGSPWLLATVSDGVSPEVALYTAPLASLGGETIPWHQVAAQADAVVGASVRGSRIDLLTHADAPHLRIVETDLAHPSFARARTVVASGSGVLTDLALAADGLYLTRRDGAVTTLLRLPDGARIPETITLPFSGTIETPVEDAGGLVADPQRPGADISLVSWVHPLVWLHYDAHSHAVTDTGILPPFPRDLKPYQAIETRIAAPDGTLVPLSIISRRDAKRDGQRPVLLDGYGAYGISYDPAFTPTILPWLDHGGVFAVAHVRGGGEGGQAWHDGGRIATKMNTITDFIACAEALISRHYTDSAHLAGTGTSAGGILIGGAITQRPELFRAALIRVGATNSTRGEFTAGGPANIPSSAPSPMRRSSRRCCAWMRSSMSGITWPTRRCC